MKDERFKMPTDEQLISIAQMISETNSPIILGNMLAMCEFILPRLQENGDVELPTQEERSSE